MEIEAMYLPAVWLFLAIVGGLIGNARGRGAFGFFLGLLLGPIGWLLLFCLPKRVPSPVTSNLLRSL